ncbi:MAG: YigZ family protein [Acholeplasmataceae bacterium]|nr:YigZ family protein [Acholeplasmataceae bacterium]
MKYILDKIENEIIIDKSRFITNLIPITSLDEANETLSQIRKAHYNATHNCYAYILENQMIQKMSDDGEPSRTAGMPILEALKANELDNVLCVVTRYFGGVKLGKGGLIRAYKNSTLEAIKKASVYTKALKVVYQIQTDYSLYEPLQYYLKDKSQILSTNYGEHVLIELYFTDLTLEALINQFNDKLIINKVGEIIVKEPLETLEISL